LLAATFGLSLARIDNRESGVSKPKLGKVGIWSMDLRRGHPPELVVEVAQELEELGYGALWLPAGIDGSIFGVFDRVLAATDRIALATGIVSIWKFAPEQLAVWWNGLSAEHRSRVLLGLGVSHSALIGEAWSKPLAMMREYLDELERQGLPLSATCIAALGPKMLELAGRRTQGSHPYMVPPQHSAIARRIMGADALVAPEVGVVLDADPVTARAMARTVLAHYAGLHNYRSNWVRMGFGEDEIAGLSDRLVDEVIVWGSPEQIAAKVERHHAAGADHVCLQVLNAGVMEGSDVQKQRLAYRELAAVLL
jgi:probable F420-dependent oxidoreductase